MSDKDYECEWCGKDSFTSQRGLTQHQQRSQRCAVQSRQNDSQNSGYHTAEEGMLYTTVVDNSKRSKRSSEVLTSNLTDNQQGRSKDLLIRRMMAKTTQLNDTQCQPCAASGQTDSDDNEEQYATAREDIDYDDDDNNVFDDDASDVAPNNIDNNRKLMLQFREYCAKAADFLPFSKQEAIAIKCMDMLRRTKASLSTYNDVMEWHFKATGDLRDHEQLGETPEFLSRPRLLNLLKSRYNISPSLYGVVKQIELPTSKSSVNIVTNDAGAMIRSLLTDPRVSDEDYLFFDNDPFLAPPEELTYLGDLNSGLSYRETYRRRVTNPAKQILCPIQMYADGCATGQFANLNITQFKIALGIHNAKARDKDYLWRDIGFIPKVAKIKSRGKRIMLDSGHCDGIMAHQDVLNTEGQRLNGGKINQLEDYHAMIATCLASYKVIQDGIILDFYYRGKLYKDVEFLFYIANIKVDNEEASRFCGQYSPKTETISQICRQCLVPTALASKSLANYPPKLEADIRELVTNNNKDALQKISQHNFRNAFWGCHFGLHDEAGIHGACMLDILHTLYLGIFMRVRDAFFEQVGPTSGTAEDLDALAGEYGELLRRQSERDLPKSTFSKGITGGKIMAKEFEGVLLLIAILLRSSEGSRLLSLAQTKNFVEDYQIADWLLLVETLLGWIQWLKSDKMELRHVKASAWKHRYIMHLIKKIMNRTKGMGMRFVKFHIISHLTSNMLIGGVAMCFDTGACESGHKPTKKAALLTQKRVDTFDIQTNERLLETHLLSLAMAELKGRPLWHYLDGYAKVRQNVEQVPGITTTGTQFTCELGEDDEEDVLEHTSRYLGDNLVAEDCYVKFIGRLQRKIHDVLRKKVTIKTEHSRNGQIFRAHMKYRGSVCRNWVEVDWGEDGLLPNKLWGFADLRNLPPNSGVNFGGLVDLSPGVYGIVENACYGDEADDGPQSEILVPIQKEVKTMVNGRVTELKFYLADTDAFVAPLCVIPDIGGAVTDYFCVKNRLQWKEEFEEWLDSPDEDNVFDEEEDDSEDDDYGETHDFTQRFLAEDEEDDTWMELVDADNEVAS